MMMNEKTTGSTGDGTALAAIVLAAGASTRFGRPKQLVPFAGTPMLHLAVRNCAAVCQTGVVVVTGAAHGEVTRSLRREQVRIAHNRRWEDGLASSIRTGLSEVPAEADAVLLMLCDQPEISRAEIEQLVEVWRAEPKRIAASRYADTIGVPAIFPRAAFPMLDTLRGDQGAKVLLERMENSLLVDMPGAELDIDSPADLEAAGADRLD